MPVLTDRQREILALLQDNKSASEIGKELGISRNAVYQQITRMRDNGVLERGYTPAGGKPSRYMQPGARVLSGILTELEQSREADDPLLGATAAHALALTMEQLRQVRDELDEITSRISAFIPR